MRSICREPSIAGFCSNDPGYYLRPVPRGLLPPDPTLLLDQAQGTDHNIHSLVTGGAGESTRHLHRHLPGLQLFRRNAHQSLQNAHQQHLEDRLHFGHLRGILYRHFGYPERVDIPHVQETPVACPVPGRPSGTRFRENGDRET